MWKVPNRLYIIVLSIPLLTAIGLFIAGIITPSGTLSDDGFSLKMAYFLASASFIFFPFVTAAGVMLYYKIINDRETYLVKNGIKGVAKILSRKQTGLYINDLPQVKFLLEITVPDSDSYQVEYKDVVSLLDLGAINTGAILPVFVDPDNKQSVLLVYSHEA